MKIKKKNKNSLKGCVSCGVEHNSINGCSSCNSRDVEVSMDQSLSDFIADANTREAEFGIDNFAGVTDNAPYTGAPGYFMVMTEKSLTPADGQSPGETINTQGS